MQGRRQHEPGGLGTHKSHGEATSWVRWPRRPRHSVGQVRGVDWTPWPLSLSPSPPPPSPPLQHTPRSLLGPRVRLAVVDQDAKQRAARAGCHGGVQSIEWTLPTAHKRQAKASFFELCRAARAARRVASVAAGGTATVCVRAAGRATLRARWDWTMDGTGLRGAALRSARTSLTTRHSLRTRRGRVNPRKPSAAADRRGWAGPAAAAAQDGKRRAASTGPGRRPAVAGDHGGTLPGLITLTVCECVLACVRACVRACVGRGTGVPC